LNRQHERENLEIVEMNISPRVLVVGSGPVAQLAALELAKMGHQVLLCNQAESIAGNKHLWGSPDDRLSELGSLKQDLRDDPRIEIMAPTRILEFQGSPGNFQVRLKGNDEARTNEVVGAVILSIEPFAMAHFESWGVKESEKIKDLSWVESILSSSGNDPLLSGDSLRTLVFLCGFTPRSWC